MTVVLAIILLLILITVHEFGHFIAARLTGIPVVEFAIGMGPKLVSWESKKYGNLFSIRLIPFGGFCAFAGEDDVKGEHDSNPLAFQKQRVWKRIVTVLMGPVMNFILAFIVALCYYQFGTVTQQIPVENSAYILSVEAQGAADRAGIQKGDQILTAGGIKIDLNDPESFLTAINQATGVAPTFDVEVKRGDETLTLPLTPFYDEQMQMYRIGVTVSMNTIESAPLDLTFMQATRYAADFCWDAATLVFRSLKMIVSQEASLDDFSGPVGVVTLISEETRSQGAQAYISLLIVISINLGIMNLLPIPGLDGSRILFMLLEAVRRKPLDQKKEAMVHLAGYALLFGFMILLTYKDILRLITGG